MIVCSVIVYFIISRCYSGKGDLWVYLYFGTAAVLAIGIIDRLGYDFLIMHDEIPLQYNIFISTIGNVNFWAGYLSIIIPFLCWHRCLRKTGLHGFYLSAFACGIFQSVYHADKYDLHRNWHCSIICCMVFTLQSQSSENLAINGILFAIAGGIAEVLWKHPCTPRAIDTDSVSKLLLAHRLYLVPGILEW